MAGNSTDPGRSVTSKVTAILGAFADSPALTLAEIIRRTELPQSTAHRLASELLAWRLLERNRDGLYRIGLSLRIIGKHAADVDILNHAMLAARAQPVLAELARTLRTDVRIGTLHRDKVLYFGRSNQHSTDMAPRSLTLPVHSTAIGRALLAFSPINVVDRILADSTGMTIVDSSPDEIRRQLSAIRVTQIATAPHEYDTSSSLIAMPVFSGGGRLAAAVELVVGEPSAGVTIAASALIVACRSLSRQLATRG
jgi:DNA-binding IclR family transcriptional regulator